MTAVPRVGRPAPEFDLPSASSAGFGRVRLSDHRGRRLAVVFYPRDFSMVCPTELTSASARIDDFRALECDVVGISVDPPDVHARWIATPQHEGGVQGLAFPLGSDVDGAVAKAYGVFDDRRGVALRGLFLIDPNGIVEAEMVLPLTVGRGTDETLRILAALRSGGLCPVNWKRPGQEIDLETVLHPGRVVGRYRIEAALGAGGYAHVFRARDIALDRVVALKVFKPRSKGTISAMLAEARLAAALSHPNVCTVYDVDDGEGVPLLAMECIEGTTLSRRIHDRALVPRAAARVLAGIAAGMAAAHDRHIVHGDLKPQNVMVVGDGAAKILDFGLARRADPHDLGRTRSGPVSGTPRYMAPERFRGRPTTAAADVFAWGVMAYESLTLEPAVPGQSVADVIRGVTNLDPNRLAAGLPPPWNEFVRLAVAREPEARTITMREIASILDAE